VIYIWIVPESVSLSKDYVDPLEQFSIAILHSWHSSNFTNVLLLHILIVSLIYKSFNYIFRITNCWNSVWVSLIKLFKDMYYKNLNIKLYTWNSVSWGILHTIFSFNSFLGSASQFIFIHRWSFGVIFSNISRSNWLHIFYER